MSKDESYASFMNLKGGFKMGHDIGLYNKAGNEIGYVRFSMNDVNSNLFYNVLDAGKYHAGVSGCGAVASFSLKQLKMALNKFNALKDEDFFRIGNENFQQWHRNEMLKFITTSLETAKKEGKVRVCFA